MLFITGNTINPNFKRILELVNIELNSFDNLSLLYSILLTQGWIQAMERHLMVFPYHPQIAHQIINICHQDLGFKKEVLPTYKTYDGIILLGGHLENTVLRVKFLQRLIKEAYISLDTKIYILTGDRQLNEAAGEDFKAFENHFFKLQKSLPKNEREMIEFAIENIFSGNLKYEVIHSKPKEGLDRATTVSTVEKFLDIIPKSSAQKRYLIISNQPLVEYQESVFKNILKRFARTDIKVEISGSASTHYYDDENNYAAILLDTIAKIIGNFVQIQ